MFETRLRIMLAVLSVVFTILVLRLADLQLVHADTYRRRAENTLILKPVSIPFVRGAIMDRTGEVLVCDEPCWDLCVDFGVLAADVGGDEDSLDSYVRRFRRSGRYEGATTDEQIKFAFLGEVGMMWSDLTSFAASEGYVETAELRERAREILSRIGRIRHQVSQYWGFDRPVAEERMAHAIVPGLDARLQIDARSAFRRYPWVHIEPSVQRTFHGDTTPLAHILGRMGRVDAQAVEEDECADDPLAKYLANEKLGKAGIEAAAERVLRGRRGQITLDRHGDVVEEVEAVDGRPVTLTIHALLQRRLYDLLGRSVSRVRSSSGGAIVVLDVESREVLALVSYPSYDPSGFSKHYGTLRDDVEGLPLRFRAVANRYAPGSIVKPLTCLAGLTSGVIDLDTHMTCTGYLFEGVTDRWRCWQIAGGTARMAHGSIDVVGALRGSCNIFMYRTGELLGVDRLCSYYDMVRIGHRTGTGLIEESRGINPTPSWLMAHKGTRPTPGTARLFAMGQAEISITPIQAANLMAMYASGVQRDVTLMAGGPPTYRRELPGTQADWLAIRRGIYEVVNHPQGTAHKTAFFEHDLYALCGKTGSATAAPWPTAYEVRYVDADGVDQTTIVRAGVKWRAIERFEQEHPLATFEADTDVEAVAWWPKVEPASGQHAHAWFGGYLQPLDRGGSPNYHQMPKIAFAVLVEFGGSGGRVAGAVAKDVAATVIDVLGPDLDAGQPVVVGGGRG